jgi:hypothetical protein
LADRPVVVRQTRVRVGWGDAKGGGIIGHAQPAAKVAFQQLGKLRGQPARGFGVRGLRTGHCGSVVPARPTAGPDNAVSRGHARAWSLACSRPMASRSGSVRPETSFRGSAGDGFLPARSDRCRGQRKPRCQTHVCPLRSRASCRGDEDAVVGPIAARDAGNGDPALTFGEPQQQRPRTASASPRPASARPPPGGESRPDAMLERAGWHLAWFLSRLHPSLGAFVPYAPRKLQSADLSPMLLMKLWIGYSGQIIAAPARQGGCASMCAGAWHIGAWRWRGVMACIQRHCAAQMRHQFGRAMRLHRWTVGLPMVRLARTSSSAPCRHHRRIAGRCARQPRGIGAQHQFRARPAAGAAGRCGLPRRQTAPGGGLHLPGALDAGGVARVDPGARCGVQLGQQRPRPWAAMRASAIARIRAGVGGFRPDPRSAR